MTQDTTPENQQAKPDTVPVEDLDSFVRHLAAWHSRKVAMLNHMQTIPEGSKMQVGKDGAEVELTGDMLAGFKAGIELALIELGSLPFVAEMEADEASTEAPVSSDAPAAA